MSAWPGTLRSHQSRTAEALDLLRAATRPGALRGQVAAVLHAQLFTAHALALAGQVGAALDELDRYARDVARLDVPRFDGRAENFRAWILRNLAAGDAADEWNAAALTTSGHAIPETELAARLDLVEGALLCGDPGAAAAGLDSAENGCYARTSI